MVGGPGSTVIRSSSISAIARTGSKAGIGTMAAPLTRQARMPAL
jgi:hypothetical protein